jgi:hypothetical protein
MSVLLLRELQQTDPAESPRGLVVTAESYATAQAPNYWREKERDPFKNLGDAGRRWWL